MTAGERFKNWIDGLAESWKDRLRGWMASWVEWGFERSLDALEPELVQQVKAQIDEVLQNPAVPPATRDLLNKVIAPKSFAFAPILIALAISAAIQPVMAAIMPFIKKIGFASDEVAASYRLDPATITRIWLRDKPAYDKLWADLKDLGWDDDRIAVVQELAKIIPPLSDMVRFADFSAFDPEVIAKWREFYDAPGFITDPMSLIGITNVEPRDWANKYWFSHYVQPGRYELGEMFRRSEGWKLGATPEAAEKSRELGVTEDDLILAYRTMAYSGFWQKRLLELAKEVPTRVDIRRWWDMRTIDEPRLRELYLKRGYFGSDLEDYVLWTKVYVAFPDLMARWTNGWITESDVRDELRKLKMPEDRINEMIQTKKKAVEAGQVQDERDLTKSEIYTGVKKGVITRAEGLELLEDLNYTREQAEYILDIRVGALEGSPETYGEFKDITTKYRIAIGKAEKPMPEELKKAAEEVVRLTKEVESLKEALEIEERGLVEEEVLPAAATEKRDELRLSLHRAEAELARVKTEYDSQVAQWRHGE